MLLLRKLVILVTKTIELLYDVFKTIFDTEKQYARLVVLSTDPDMALKSLARVNFELFRIFSQK